MVARASLAVVGPLEGHSCELGRPERAARRGRGRRVLGGVEAAVLWRRHGASTPFSSPHYLRALPHTPPSARPKSAATATARASVQQHGFCCPFRSLPHAVDPGQPPFGGPAADRCQLRHFVAFFSPTAARTSKDWACPGGKGRWGVGAGEEGGWGSGRLPIVVSLVVGSTVVSATVVASYAALEAARGPWPLRHLQPRSAHLSSLASL